MTQESQINSPKHSSFIEALTSRKAVSGLTHTYYRYPARFSPEFAREAIELFTKPGDFVLDPFVGGGTSAVEAIAAGRNFVGSDINQLAHFISRVKTTTLSRNDARGITAWAQSASESFDIRNAEPRHADWEPYQTNIPWRIRRVLAHLIAPIASIKSPRQRAFARCSVLNAAQWALDCKSKIPAISDLLLMHGRVVRQMLDGNAELKARAAKARAGDLRAVCRLYCGDTADLQRRSGVRALGHPKLVLTSPPYLGVHVLYHRWQVLGRRETPAPYWIVDKPDGHGGAFYTFADRKSLTHERYMQRLRDCFGSVRAVCDRKSLIVQLVAFPDADIQLPFYLQALAEIGLHHCESIDTTLNVTDLAREVPNRRWYALINEQSTSSKEFLLVHRLRRI